MKIKNLNKMSMKGFLVVTLISTTLSSKALSEQSTNEKSIVEKKQTIETPAEAISSLDRIIHDFEFLGFSAERYDIGRLMVLQNRANEVKTYVSNRGLGSMKTINLYQKFVLTLKYSQGIFEKLATPNTRQAIAEINEINSKIIEARDFDKEITTQLVAGVLSDISNLLLQLNAQELPKDLKNWLMSELVPLLSDALAKARAHGDVPAVYDAGAEIIKIIRNQYDVLGRIHNNNTTYKMITQLMGLSEFYMEIYNRGRPAQDQEAIAQICVSHKVPTSNIEKR